MGSRPTLATARPASAANWAETRPTDCFVKVSTAWASARVTKESAALPPWPRRRGGADEEEDKQLVYASVLDAPAAAEVGSSGHLPQNYRAKHCLCEAKRFSSNGKGRGGGSLGFCERNDEFANYERDSEIVKKGQNGEVGTNELNGKAANEEHSEDDKEARGADRSQKGRHL